MTEKDFIYWLQGFFEIADPKSIDEKQIQIIKDHIALVLKKETPNRHEVKIVSDPLVPPGQIILKKEVPGGKIFTPRCQGGMGHCGGLGCKDCNSSLILTC